MLIHSSGVPTLPALLPRNFRRRHCTEINSLALALRVLEPRPQALLIGGGYSHAEVADAQVVFREFADEVGVFDGTVVVVRQSVANRDGVAMWVIGELRGHFEGRTASQGSVDRVLAI